MKKIILAVLIIFLVFSSNAFAFFKKEEQKPVLVLSSKDFTSAFEKGLDSDFSDFKQEFFFKKDSRIYFYIYNPKGFKADYIRYQIVKQNDLAFTGGFERVRNITLRLKDKNFCCDYFVITTAGRYYIQFFDIQNLQQWVTMGSFQVLND